MKFIKKLIGLIITVVIIAYAAEFFLGGFFYDDEYWSYDDEYYNDEYYVNEYDQGSGSGSGSASSDLPDTAASSSPAARGVSMSVADDGSVDIKRLSQKGHAEMGEADKWTIFVYLCGSDLESDGGYATMDIKEMVSGATGSGMRFVVQTGGSSDWANSFVDPRSSQRFVIENGKMSLVDRVELSNMGDYRTLASFLSWGVKNYPSEHMGVIFWNHGGGSIAGVCYDENAYNDCLSLREIDAAFASVWPSMTDSFEFIGFDACLMGTSEVAYLTATYADYLYGSEETESGYGWNYKAIGNFLNKNSDAGGAELGKVIVDSYYESCRNSGEEAETTLSVIDLSGIDNLVRLFNLYAKDLYQSTSDQTAFSKVARKMSSVTNFGGNNWSSGYTNMVDLGCLVRAGGAKGADEVLKALEDVVVYMKNGRGYPDATGLAIYYPLSIGGSNELTVLSEISFSPYYLSFVDRAARGGGSYGNGNYSIYELFDLWDSVNGATQENAGQYEEAQQANEEYWQYYDQEEQGGESELISFAVEPGFGSDGYFGFTLTREALDCTLNVEGNVYYVKEDEMFYLGATGDIYADWDEGRFTENFDGYWFSLPDGQNLTVLIETEGDGFDIYSSPVKVNGKRTNLILHHDYKKDVVTILGIRDPISEEGMAGRITSELSKGDVIIPLYYAVALEGEGERWAEGSEYVYNGYSALEFGILPDGEYLYNFTINDIYGGYFDTESITFTIKGDEILY